MSNREMLRKKKRRKCKFFKYFFRVFWILVLLALLAVMIVVLYGYLKIKPVIETYYNDAVQIVKESSPEDFKTNQTSYVYDSSGNQLVSLKLDQDSTYVEYEDIPQIIIDATVAVEDKRYWEHEGVDWKSTLKAAYLYVTNPGSITRGGSTITQQLVKNKFLTFEQTTERKAREIFLAMEMEKKYTKEQVLEFYLNNISYSNGYYGIASAAKGYFDKSLSELTLEEVAFLCGIPNNPTLYNPLRYIENTTQRRNLILKRMKDQKYVTTKEFVVAVNSPIVFNKCEKNVYSYETSYAIHCAVRALMKLNNFNFKYHFGSKKSYKKYCVEYEKAYDEAKDALYSGGYKVYTTLNSDLQKYVQSVVDKELEGFKQKNPDGSFAFQAACTVVDNQSGNVIAIVGGRSQKKFENILTINRAYQSYRQPGSTFKPIAVYTPAFELGYTPKTIVNDSKIEEGPSNSNGKYEGKITLRRAVEQSKNVVAWQIFNEIGPSRGLDCVERMHFSKIMKSDYNLSSALGGLTYGVTTVEMASAYRTLANDGIFTEPTCIKEIVNANGKQVYVGWDSERIYTEDAARTMTDVLQGVATYGTAKVLKMDRGMPIACKTGTTNDQTNGWFCAYTPYYTTACYVGFDNPVKVNGLWGSSYPLQISENIQNHLCKKKKVVAFKKVTKKVKLKPTPTAKPDSNAQEIDEHSWRDTQSSSPSQQEETATPKATRKPTPKPTKKPKVKPTKEPVIEVTPEPEPIEEPENSKEPESGEGEEVWEESGETEE